MNNLKLKTIVNTLIFLLLLGIVSCSPKVQTAIAEWSDCKDTCEQKKEECISNCNYDDATKQVKCTGRCLTYYVACLEGCDDSLKSDLGVADKNDRDR